MPKKYIEWKSNRNGLCIQCNEESEVDSVLCKEHLLIGRETRIKRGSDRRDHGLCVGCGVVGIEPGKYCDPCRIKRRQPSMLYQRRKRAQERINVFNHYGNQCSCCREAENSFLSIDHIGGGGNEHRRKLNGKSFYKWLIKNGFPPGFRTLCMNCQFGTRMGGLCPHETT